MRTSEPLVAALRLLRPRMSRLLLAISFGIVSLGSALALAAVSAWLITRAWQMPPVLDLSIAAVAVRALAITRGVMHYCERLASHDTALRAASNARAEIYGRLADQPTAPAARLSGGDLAGRLGADVDEVSDVLVRAILPIAVAAVLSVSAVAGIALISAPPAAVLAGCLLAAGVGAPWLSARAATRDERVARLQHAGRDDATMLALDHAAELRVSGRLPIVIAEAAQHQRDWARATDRAAIPAAFAAAVPVAAVGISVLGAAVAGIALSAAASPMTVAILMLLPLSAFEATTALPAAAVSLTRARIAAARLVPLSLETVTRRPSAGPVPAHATLRADLHPGPPVELPSGARLAVTGPSGAGKTTLLMTLVGLIAPRAGSVTLAGTPLSSYDDAALRSAVTFFAEDAHIFATTVRDNLLVVRGDCTDAEILGALGAVGLRDWLDALPHGLATVLTGGAAAVSAGQRRRLLLARALLSRSAIVLLDEPTEHLDADSADAILREVFTPGALFDADRTVVVATHHLPPDLGCPRLNVDPDRYPGCQSAASGLTGVLRHD